MRQTGSQKKKNNNNNNKNKNAGRKISKTVYRRAINNSG
jgi:hypothetical protein